MAAVCEGRAVRLKNTESGDEEMIFKEDLGSVHSVAFSPTSPVLALTSESAIWFRNTEEKEEKPVFEVR